MNSDMTSKIITTGSDATVRLGLRLGERLPGGSIIELRSDLGGGKTTFVKGLAEGLGYDGQVASPTFTFSRIYPLPDGRELHHFDLYRLTGHDVVTDDLIESAGLPSVITVIEWPEVASDKLPEDRLVITITMVSEDTRELQFHAPTPELAAIVREVTV